MEIRLKKLILRNFKGTTSLSIDFNDVTNISGDNGTGKTTVFDAFTWCLFGKDSMDRKDFNIKPLDSEGKCDPQTDHEVECALKIRSDEKEYTKMFRRTFKEKWVKKRGREEQEFQGHETLYFVDGVPCTMKEYIGEVESLCSESVFKLITNPRYFPLLNWTVQRSTLIAMAGGDIPDSDIINSEKRFSVLFDKLNGKTIEQYKKQIANEKTRIKDELEQIPSRIDEATRTLSDPVNISKHGSIIIDHEKKIIEIENAEKDASESLRQFANQQLDIQRRINTTKGKIQDIQFAVKQELKKSKNELQAEYNNIRDRIVLLRGSNNTIALANQGLEKKISEQETEKAELLKAYISLKAEQFVMDEKATVCPTCNRELDPDTIDTKREEMLAQWNRKHTDKLNDNISKGKSLRTQIETDSNKVIENNKAIEETNAKIEALLAQQKEIEEKIPTLTDDQYNDLTDDFLAGKRNEYNTGTLKSIREDYDNIVSLLEIDQKELDKLHQGPVQGTVNRIEEKAELKERIEVLRSEITNEERNAKTTARISELKESQKKLSQELAGLEKDEYLMADFTKAKIMAIEQKINSLFTIVKFRMFNILINGAEEPTCEAYVDGVPYSDLNNAAKINAGLDIINAISDNQNVIAPVFLDNREAVNKIIPTRSQIINLTVTTDKKLVIS